MDVICIDLTLCDSLDVTSPAARAAYDRDPVGFFATNHERRLAAEMAADDAPAYVAHRRAWED